MSHHSTPPRAGGLLQFSVAEQSAFKIKIFLR